MGDHNSLLLACKFLYKNMGFNNIITWDKPCYIKDSEYFIKISGYDGFKYIKEMTITNSFNGSTPAFNIFTLPEFNKLSSLSKLTLCGNTSLSHNIEGLDVLNKLHTLVIDRYRYMTNISSIATMYNITDLSILDCFRIIDYSPLSSMINLNKLSLTCFNKNSLSSISSLINIKHLYINLYNTTDIKPLSNLKKLETLSIVITSSIFPVPVDTYNIELSYLSSLKNLFSLSIDSYSIFFIDSISLLTNLTNLELLTPRLHHIIDISKLINIKYLKIKSPNIFKIDPLINLINIQYLTLICSELDNISPLRKLTKLLSFTCETDKHLCICPIFRLTNLEELNISCGKLINMASLNNLINIKILKISVMDSLTTIFPISYLYNITHIEITRYCGKDLSALSKLPNLSHIHFDVCHSLIDISALSNMTCLRSITFSYCYALIDINPLINLYYLTYLKINNCNKLIDTSVLKYLKRLIISI